MEEIESELAELILKLKGRAQGMLLDELVAALGDAAPNRRTLQRRLVDLIERRYVDVTGTTRTLRYAATAAGLAAVAPSERVPSPGRVTDGPPTAPAPRTTVASNQPKGWSGVAPAPAAAIPSPGAATPPTRISPPPPAATMPAAVGARAAPVVTAPPSPASSRSPVTEISSGPAVAPNPAFANALASALPMIIGYSNDRARASFVLTNEAALARLGRGQVDAFLAFALERLDHLTAEAAAECGITSEQYTAWRMRYPAVG